MVFSEIEPYADAIVLGWDNITDEAYAHIISGEVEPSGLLQFQMPASMDTVEAQDEDVPRDMGATSTPTATRTTSASAQLVWCHRRQAHQDPKAAR